MTFEDQINKLAGEAVACTSEEQAVVLARRMQVLMHERIEALRENLITVPPVGPVVQSAVKDPNLRLKESRLQLTSLLAVLAKRLLNL